MLCNVKVPNHNKRGIVGMYAGIQIGADLVLSPSLPFLNIFKTTCVTDVVVSIEVGIQCSRLMP